VAFAFGRKQLKFGVPRPLVVSEAESIAVSEAESIAVPTLRDAKGAASIFCHPPEPTQALSDA
jgi:hypothetical protein